MLKKLPKSVRIIEVGPRDGLQNEKTIVKTEDKLEFIKLLSRAGIHEIEATSFVRSEKIPQMTDGVELFHLLQKETALLGNKLVCLVPNAKGMEKALEVKAHEVAVFTSTSNTFNQKNINATIDESLVRIKEVCKMAKDNKVAVRGYISTVFGCPYEGETSLEELDRVIHALLEMGVYEISIGDTIGVANPLQVTKVIDFIKKKYPLEKFAMHFHDTRGMAIANILTSLEYGITNFDSSAAGLGGCPYAKGASGNVATEDLVYLFDSMNIHTGIDFHKLYEASSFILEKVNRQSISKAYLAYRAKCADMNS